MSEAVDKLITDLENNWGAKPKPGNVSPQAKAVPEGEYGIAYTAKPVKADPVIMDAVDVTDIVDLKDVALATAIDEMGAIPGSAAPPWHPNCDNVKEKTMKPKTLATVPKGTFDVSKLMTAPTTTMLKATKLYQPVRGTSSGSRYFIIAISKAIRVAARWKQASNSEGLALRVEGSGLSNPYTVKMLEQIGLDKKSEIHMSAHLTVTSDIEARKAIGALLFAINEPWTTPRPDPGVICV